MKISENIKPFITLLELKEDHKVLGDKGTIYHLADFINDVETENMKLLIDNAYYEDGCVHVENGSCTITEENVDKLFTILNKTLKEYVEELESRYGVAKEG